MASIKKIFTLKWIFLTFFFIFTLLSFKSMLSIPFHDFDEAHRAENAKRMNEYKSYFVPLTGSSQDRVEGLRVPLKENPNFHLYYHLERPPLVYLLMIVSTILFGTSEWAYRFPSFMLGITALGVLLFFAKRTGKNILAISTGLLTLITSSDLWLSSQSAQMDTGITLFLFLSLLTLIYYCLKRKLFLIYLSGAFLGFGLLSKLQPAVIIIFPLTYLILTKKISIVEFLKFIMGFSIVFLPWILYLVLKFGIKDVFLIMPGFALSSASIIDIHHEAPLFWYIRWWWEAFRPGWTLFLALLFYEIKFKALDWKKITLLTYIIGGLIAFSLPDNKLWWYVLPLVPAVAFYIFLSIKDYLGTKVNKLNNLSFIIIIASLPLFLKSSNTTSMLYGISITIISYFILVGKITLNLSSVKFNKSFFNIAVILSLIFFLLQFPTIIPYHYNTKPVAQFYKSLPYPKCLWLGDMPTEAVLFYSNAGEVLLLNENSQIYQGCRNNYLITPDRNSYGKLLIREGNIRLYQLTKDYEVLND